MPQQIIKRNRVHLGPSERRDGPSDPRLLEDGSPAPCSGEKGVRLVNEGGRARAIEFTCSCGEVTVVELMFDEAVAEEMP